MVSITNAAYNPYAKNIQHNAFISSKIHSRPCLIQTEH